MIFYSHVYICKCVHLYESIEKQKHLFLSELFNDFTMITTHTNRLTVAFLYTLKLQLFQLFLTVSPFNRKYHL